MIVELFLLFVLVCGAQQPTFYSHWSATLTDVSSRLNFTVGVDVNNRYQMSRGRASVIVLSSSKTQMISSYDLYNGTFTLQYPFTTANAQNCVFQQGSQLKSIFDLSDQGWLADATSTTAANGDTLYYYYNNISATPYVTNGGSYLYSSTYLTVSALVAQGDTVPYAINVSSGSWPNFYPYAQYLISDFDTNPRAQSKDGDWAPPGDGCLTSHIACNGTATVETKIVYRSHNNDTYRYVLENANTASAAGEVYFACHLSPGPFVTQFKVRMSTRYNAYSECTGGSCSFYFSAANPITYGVLLGVGREESLGNNHGDGFGQCDTTDADVGYWYSMNVGGRCPFGKKIPYNNCTWEADYVPLKTITLQCANTQSLCSTTNWTQAGEALESAFKTCPAVNAMLVPASTPYQDYLRVLKKQQTYN